MAQPAPPVLAPGVPYTVFDTRVFWIVPTIANINSPTLSELNAGKDVTGCVAAISGFSSSTASIDIPRAGTTFTGSLPGRRTAADSSITFYLADDGVDIRTLLTEGLKTNVVICTEGNDADLQMSVFPVRVGSVSVMEDLEASGQAEVSFYIYATPAEYIDIPTS